MARKPRIEFPGAFYHVIARGNNRQKIFIDGEDYRHFLERLSLYKERFKFVLYAYVLMPNHIHLLLETAEIPLSRIMQALQFTYTQKFNRRYKKVGHLFQGRYKAILCQKESYLLELIRYIILNPVRARLVERPIDWRWSSYHDLLRLKNGHIVSFEEVLGLFGKRKGAAVKSLQRYINNGLPEGHNESYYRLKDQRILGEDDFAKEVMKTGEASAGGFEYYEIKIDEIIKLVAGRMNIEEAQVRSATRGRAGAKGRGVVAYISKMLGGMTVKEVSIYFGRSEAALSKAIKSAEHEMTSNDNFGRLMKKIEMDIKARHEPCLVREIRNRSSAK